MSITTNSMIRFNDCKDLIQTSICNILYSNAANLDGEASGGWAKEVNQLFRPGGYVKKDVTVEWFRGGARLYRSFTVSSPQVSTVSKATIKSQYTNYIEQCLSSYPVNTNTTDALFKSLLWLINCSYVFSSRKLVGLTSSLVPDQIVLIYDVNANVPVITDINNNGDITNPFYAAGDTDALINSFNQSLIDKICDQTVRNYTQKDNITSLLNSFTSNLQNTVRITSMQYITSFASCSCCSSSCCSSSSFFLAYIAV